MESDEIEVQFICFGSR